MVVKQNYTCPSFGKKGIILYYIIFLSDLKLASNKSN